MEVVFVTQAVAPPLDNTDLVVEPFDEPQGYLVLRPAVCGDAFPVSFNEGSELLERLESLPAQ